MSRAGPSVSAAARRPGPDQVIGAVVAFEELGEDRCDEARVVELQRR